MKRLVMLLLAWSTVGLLAQSPHGDPTNSELVTIRELGGKTGINFVFVSEGFAAADKEAFVAAVRAHDEVLARSRPTAAYAALFNVYALFVPSADSGIDDYSDPSNPVLRDTVFDTRRADGGFIVKNMRADWLKSTVPFGDFFIYMPNSTQYGGWSAYEFACVSAHSSLYDFLLYHELMGHSVGGMTDEYRYSWTDDSSEMNGYPNLARSTAMVDVPWRHWIRPGVPVPTPVGREPMYGTEVALYPPEQTGVFLGGATPKGYRPNFESFMRLARPDWQAQVYEMHREQIIRRLYQFGGPIISPASATQTVAPDSEGILGLEISVRSVASNLIVWTVDGKEVAEGLTRISLDTRSLNSGKHTAKVLVIDGTDDVRLDFRRGLEETRTWEFTTTGPATQPADQLVRSDFQKYPRQALRNGRIVALSTRGLVDSANKRLIAGFVVTGTAPKRLLIRGGGPILVSRGVAQAAPNPKLTLFDAAGTPILENDDWDAGTNVTQVEADAQSVGAGPFPRGSKDAAISVSLPPGLYTCHLTDASGGNGVALFEVFDLSPDVGRLIAISTRGWIAPGEQNMIVGFVTTGSEAKRLLIRGVGPGLRSLGVGQAVTKTKLDLVKIGTETYTVAANSGWINHPTPWLTNLVGRQTGLMALAENNQDSALLATLQPGVYTAVVTPENETGEALVEVYEVE